MGSDRIGPDMQTDLALCLSIIYYVLCIEIRISISLLFILLTFMMYIAVVVINYHLIGGARISRPFALMDQQQALQLMEEPSLPGSLVWEHFP